MFQIELLPVAHGDALWIEFGDPDAPTRVVIDGGPAPTYSRGLRARVDVLRGSTSKLPSGRRAIDLFVVSHIDCDHIDGAVIFLQQCRELDVPVREIWFNGWKQLGAASEDTFQPLQGEFLGALVSVDAAFRNVWNASFRAAPSPDPKGPLLPSMTAVSAVAVPKAGPLPRIPIGNGGTLILLSPFATQLQRLRRQWSTAIRAFNPGDEKAALERLNQRREYRPPPVTDVFSAETFGADRSAPNGSSIAFVLEYEGRRCLFAADAHARVLATSLRQLAKEEGVDRIRFDAIKLPHHGSMGNISEEFLATVTCDNWLISTNGAIFDHPDRAAVELICKGRTSPASIFCNYRVPSTERLIPKPGEAWKVQFAGDDSRSTGPVGGLRIPIPISRSPGEAVAVGEQRATPVTTPPTASNPREQTVARISQEPALARPRVKRKKRAVKTKADSDRRKKRMRSKAKSQALRRRAARRSPKR